MDQRLAGVEGQLDNADTIYGNVRRIGSPDLNVPFDRVSRRHHVIAPQPGEYIDGVARKYVKHQNKGARFAVRVNRAEEGDL
jgi:hypothetical protein